MPATLVEQPLVERGELLGALCSSRLGLRSTRLSLLHRPLCVACSLRAGMPVIVDDGVMSYCIYGRTMMGGEPWWVIADPHVRSQSPRRHMSSTVFFDRAWMALVWQ